MKISTRVQNYIAQEIKKAVIGDTYEKWETARKAANDWEEKQVEKIKAAVDALGISRKTGYDRGLVEINTYVFDNPLKPEADRLYGEYDKARTMGCRKTEEFLLSLELKNSKEDISGLLENFLKTL